MPDERELRDSIAVAGCVDPVLIWLGVIIDGRRRHRICEELGIVPPMRVCISLEAACTALFAKHPERAVLLAREHLGGHAGLAPTVRELARVCNASVSAIAVLVTPPKAAEKRGPRRACSQRTEGVKLWVEPQWLHYVKRAGLEHGMNLSQTIRVACWEWVQRNDARAPTEGTYRAPSIEHVRKPERRSFRR